MTTLCKLTKEHPQTLSFALVLHMPNNVLLQKHVSVVCFFRERERGREREREKKTIGVNFSFSSALICFHKSGTCAHWEIGNVLIAEGLFIWDIVCEKSQSRATHDSYLWPVSRPAHQPFCSQFAVIKGTAAESGERKSDGQMHYKRSHW